MVVTVAVLALVLKRKMEDNNGRCGAITWLTA